MPPQGNAAEMLLASSAAAPERPAIVDGATSTSFEELSARALRVAAGLSAAGVEPGDRVAILARGRLVTEGPVTEVLAHGRASRLLVRVDPLDVALATLRSAELEASVEDDHILVQLPVEEAARVTRVLADARLYLRELRPEEVDLETVFLELTSGQADPGS